MTEYNFIMFFALYITFLMLKKNNECIEQVKFENNKFMKLYNNTSSNNKKPMLFAKKNQLELAVEHENKKLIFSNMIGIINVFVFYHYFPLFMFCVMFIMTLIVIFTFYTIRAHVLRGLRGINYEINRTK